MKNKVIAIDRWLRKSLTNRGKQPEKCDVPMTGSEPEFKNAEKAQHRSGEIDDSLRMLPLEILEYHANRLEQKGQGAKKDKPTKLEKMSPFCLVQPLSAQVVEVIRVFFDFEYHFTFPELQCSIVAKRLRDIDLLALLVELEELSLLCLVRQQVGLTLIERLRRGPNELQSVLCMVAELSNLK